MTLRTLNYGNYGIVLIMGNAGFCPSTVKFKVPHTAGLDPWQDQHGSFVTASYWKGWARVLPER